MASLRERVGHSGLDSAGSSIDNASWYLGGAALPHQ
ncbi:hypothetical protein MGAST_25590 [Mycobacterium gastri 'Wayne']|nr:hypothetical protein MGAST_25590 [Mycobacterium gastri 'Wayne']